jgi:dUTP pyrophosphatase
MQVKFKLLDEKAVLPSYAKPGDAGLDITIIDDGKKVIDPKGIVVTYRTGLSVEIPDGHVGFIFPRSSITNKTPLILGNSVGVIDSQYRGEILVQFRDLSNGYSKNTYKTGDRVAQLVILPFPLIEPISVSELTETVRGTSGFGSSDS